MQRKYSKPSGDIAYEGQNIIDQELALQKTILDVTDKLKTYSKRIACILCDNNLEDSETFDHRGISFKHCSVCGHIQTERDADESYEKEALKSLGYEGIYPDMDHDAYVSRAKRVYEPKTRWIWDALINDDQASPEKLKWCDIGCGAGYLLQTLQARGCEELVGFDIDAHNLEIATKMIGENVVRRSDMSFDETLKCHEADIYTAFFVLEHVRDTNKTIKALSAKPKGTYFAFSVPVFGFIAAFESIIKDHYPRCLDAMMHTQIYTDQSIEYFLKHAGFEMVSEWVFGQDMMDIHRFMNVNLSRQYPESLRDQVMDKISSLVDPMQSAIDQAHFADARHILAKKI